MMVYPNNSKTKATPAPSHTSDSNRFAVGLFPNLSDAEHAVTTLRSIGFSEHQLTVVAHALQRQPYLSGVNLCDRLDSSPVHIPATHVQDYQDRLHRGDHLLIVAGTDGELHHAEALLNRRHIQAWHIYDPATVNPEAAPGLGEATAPGTLSSKNSPIPHPRQIVGFFYQQQDVEQTITNFRMAGFPLGQILLVAQHVEQPELLTGVDVRDRCDDHCLGLPPERIRFFNTRIAHGHYLVAVHGTPEQLQQAEVILKRAQINSFGICELPKIEDRRLDMDRGRDNGESELETPQVAIVVQHEEIYGDE